MFHVNRSLAYTQSAVRVEHVLSATWSEPSIIRFPFFDAKTPFHAGSVLISLKALVSADTVITRVLSVLSVLVLIKSVTALNRSEFLSRINS